ALHPDRTGDSERGKLVLFYDEAHKFAQSPVIREQMRTLVRERRHLDVNIILSSQDPPSVPQDLLPLLDGIGLFTHESEVWNRCLGRACHAFSELNTAATSVLPAGVMWFWSRDWLMFDQSDGAFDGRLMLVDVRPRASHHGGATRRATAAT